MRTSYKNRNGKTIKIFTEKAFDSSAGIIEGADLPFLFEPDMSCINKRERDVYYTYSLGRKNVSCYFDDARIWEQKQYSIYIANTKVVFWGASDKNCDFLKDSIQFYQTIFGEKHVQYVDDWRNITLEDGKEYLFQHASFRVISPYIVKFYHVMSSMISDKERVGLLSPNQTYCPDDIKLLWGSKKAIERYKSAKEYFFDNAIWKDFIFRYSIVADLGMFSYMDMDEVFSNLANKERKVEFIEWMLQLLSPANSL